MLKVKAIHVYYGAIHALKGVSFEVQQGELVTLLGANGAGKTTTLKTLSGLLRPARGSVELEGKTLHRIDADEIVRRGVAHVPEGRKVFPRFTVLENLKIGGYTRHKSALAPELDFVFQMFPRLKERQKQYAGTLSGGEQQMLAIARALMAKPKLLLLDEPSMGLAPKIVEQILENIRTINERALPSYWSSKTRQWRWRSRIEVMCWKPARSFSKELPETLPGMIWYARRIWADK